MLEVGGLDSYKNLYEYSKVQYKEYYKKLSKLPIETISKYQTGYFQNIIEKITAKLCIFITFFLYKYTKRWKENTFHP